MLIFDNLFQTPITAEITKCFYVAVKNSVFSRLQTGKFEDVTYLDLSEGAFTFENQGDIGRHGPLVNVSKS